MYYTRLRQLRGERTQAEMASMIGMSQVNYGYYENGKQPLKSTQIEQICKTFGCSAEWLLCFEPQDDKSVDPDEMRLLTAYAELDDKNRCVLLTVAKALVFASQGAGAGRGL